MADYLLGDGRNLDVDRKLADLIERTVPDIGLVVRLNRVFTLRAVNYLVAAGVRQFLDLTVGTTAVGNVHDVAQAVDPSCRVVYVHNNPIAVAYTGQLIAGVEGVAVVQASPRDAEPILAACRDGDLLDFTAPVAVLMVGVLPFLPDSANLVKMVAGYRERIVPGSYLVISHLSGDQRPVETAAVVQMMRETLDPVHPRTREEVVRLFAGFDLVAPGVVHAGGWHAERPLDPAEELASSLIYAGVGRKPEPPA